MTKTASVTHQTDGEPVGLHLIVDLHNAQNLNDKAHIEATLREASVATGATLLHIHTHYFAPQGVTGVAVLAESHITCHTWPERGFAAFDIFMCGSTDPYAAISVLRSAFKTDDTKITELRRGTRD